MLLSLVPMRKSEAWERRKTGRTQVFPILVPFLLSLLRNGSSLIYPFVFWPFYKVLFESIVSFQKYWNKLSGCSKIGNLSFRNMKPFQPPILIKKTAFPITKVEVIKPDLRRIYFHMIPDQRNAGTYIDVLGNSRGNC